MDSYSIESNVYAKDTGVYGKSLFAKKDFKKDDLVFVAFGPITSQDSYHTIPISKDLYIEPREPEGNLSQYICHSCEPNLGVKGRAMFVAMQDIKKDDELAIDYAMICDYFPEQNGTDWKNWPNWECKCGKPKCRGKVMGYFQLPEADQKKYADYVSDYIVEN